MLKSLALANVGSRDVAVDFSKSTIVVADVLGFNKSMFLDATWYALTHTWPADVNRKLIVGFPILPRLVNKKATITFSFTKGRTCTTCRGVFDRKNQAWQVKPTPVTSGIVVYAMADGGFAVWDSVRNGFGKNKIMDSCTAPPAYVFTMKDLWDGQYLGAKSVCNGMVMDWASWQRENGEIFEMFCAMLSALSSGGEPMIPGSLRRMSLMDSRDIPTLRYLYGDVFITHLPLGVKRLICLAYALTWALKEHCVACGIAGIKKSTQLTLIYDDLESQLSQTMQEAIVYSLCGIFDKVSPSIKLQLIATTQSSFVLSALDSISLNIINI